jgi:hypothetical protein
MHLKFVFLLVLFLSTNSLAGGNLKINDFAVTKATYIGISTREKKEERIERAAVIKIIKINSESSMITSIGAPLYGYDTMWIPNGYLLQESQFKKVKKWSGDKELDVVFGDYEAIYKIKKDGSFTYRSSKENGTPFERTGHLYESSGTFWPKFAGNPLSYGEIFFKLNDGNICWSVISPCVFP